MLPFHQKPSVNS